MFVPFKIFQLASYFKYFEIIKNMINTYVRLSPTFFYVGGLVYLLISPSFAINLFFGMTEDGPHRPDNNLVRSGHFKSGPFISIFSVFQPNFIRSIFSDAGEGVKPFSSYSIFVLMLCNTV